MPVSGVMIYPVAARLTNDEQLAKVDSETDEFLVEKAAGNRLDMVREAFDAATAWVTLARNNCVDDAEFYQLARETAEKNSGRGYFNANCKPIS